MKKIGFILVVLLLLAALTIIAGVIVIYSHQTNNQETTPSSAGNNTTPVGDKTTSSPPSSNSGGSKTNTAIINAVSPPMKPGDRNYTNFSSILSSPLVNGVNPSLSWGMIDQGPGASGGQYQFSTFDSEIQRFIDAGKTVNIIVYPIDYSSSLHVPSYVLNDPTLDKLHCNPTNIWPVVYEPPFKNAYKAFIAAVLKHYANNPHIGYIRFGLSRGGEIYPFCNQQEAALLNMSVSEWTTQVWAAYDKEMLDYEKSLNPTMKILAPTTQFGPPDVADAEAANAVAVGFGFGSQGLRLSDIANYPNCNGDWCNLFNKYTGQVPLELQTIGLSDPTGICGTSSNPPCPGNIQQQTNQQNTGPLPPLLTLGLQ